MVERAHRAHRRPLARAEKLLDMLHGSWMSQAVCVAAELGVADLLARGPQTPDRLARKTGCHAPSLARLMRALASLGLCVERAGGSYALTPTGALLRSGTAGSLRAWALWWGRQLWPLWGHLGHSIRTGQSARVRVTGQRGFDPLERDPALAALFNQAMAELTRHGARAVARAYDFSRLRRIVDVGGGHGELLAAILRAFPRPRGVLFDRPHAAAGGRRRLKQAGLAARCRFVAGDFFVSVPGGADAYLLKSVIDDWSDTRARIILGNCRKAMGAGGVLLLIEPLMPERAKDSAAHRAMARADLTMLLTHGGRERTAGEMRRLLEASGYTMGRVVPTATRYNVIEAFPRRGRRNRPGLSAARRKRA